MTSPNNLDKIFESKKGIAPTNLVLVNNVHKYKFYHGKNSTISKTINKLKFYSKSSHQCSARRQLKQFP